MSGNLSREEEASDPGSPLCHSYSPTWHAGFALKRDAFRTVFNGLKISVFLLLKTSLFWEEERTLDRESQCMVWMAQIKYLTSFCSERQQQNMCGRQAQPKNYWLTQNLRFGQYFHYFNTSLVHCAISRFKIKLRPNDNPTSVRILPRYRAHNVRDEQFSGRYVGNKFIFARHVETAYHFS